LLTEHAVDLLIKDMRPRSHAHLRLVHHLLKQRAPPLELRWGA
jgi:hypothetical protein